jgi:hypothetical protein
MSDIDTSKLTPEQKAALAQVEATLASHKSAPVRDGGGMLKYFAAGIVIAIFLAGLYFFVKAQETL